MQQEQETHWVCQNNLRKNGGASLCCECFPHGDKFDCGDDEEINKYKAPKEELCDCAGELSHEKDCASLEPTPTEPQEDWEIELYKKFVVHCSDGDILGTDSKNEVNKLKAFIRKLLSTEREKAYREGIAEGIQRTESDNEDSHYIHGLEIGKKQARQEYKKEIKEQIYKIFE
jgi:hypothetical protein